MKAHSTSDARVHKPVLGLVVVIAFIALFSFDNVREGMTKAKHTSLPALTVSNHNGVNYLTSVDVVAPADDFFDHAEDVTIENWMSDLRLWKKSATLETVSEAAPQLKSWMFNADWLTSSCTEVVAIQNWMSDTSSWCLSNDEIVPLCAWMFCK